MKAMKKYFVYHLICPIENTVKYVGKTSKPKTRYNQHIKKLDKQMTPKRMWLESLFENGLLPKLEIIAEFEDDILAREAEQKQLDMNISTALNIHNPRKGAKSSKWRNID